ncbi:MAG: hypothetical protein QM710_14605 [Flavobacterium sp.]
MIPTFPYKLNSEDWEIFPEEICSDPYVVFHGTSSFHSQNIEQNGWIKGHSPYDVEDASELASVLELPLIKPFDKAIIWDLTTAKTIRNYVAANKFDQFRLSFTYLSSLGVLFSTGKSKGGQTIGNIRNAKEIIENATIVNPSLEGIVSNPINKLFNLAEEIDKKNGVVYALKLPKELDGITEEHGVIHSISSIPKEFIVGKVIIPDDVDLSTLDRNFLKERNRIKLNKAGHLGIILGRRKYSEE